MDTKLYTAASAADIHEKSSVPAARPAARARVVVVGLGYVGLPLALLARTRGHETKGIDLDPQKLSAIRNNKVPDLDERSRGSLAREPFTVASDFAAVAEADIVVVCVPTPVDSQYVPDLKPLLGACKSVAEHLQKGQLVVVESTVHPGTAQELVIPLMEEVSGLRAGVDFDIAHCPERINPGDAQWPIEKIPRVVGATTPQGRARAADFYRSILSAGVHEMETIREAEAVKMVENSFRDINIAFVNELAMSFTKLGIDVTNVLRGASTKPFGFMMHTPGCGVGGHCIPVDPYYLIRYAKQNGFTHRFLSLARDINNHMPHFTVELLEQELEAKGKKLKGAEVALLGLSYKPNVSDLRESPALEIAELLVERGAHVRSWDPHIRERSTAVSLTDALKGADAAVIATAHRAFEALSPAALKANGVDIVIDGRNMLSKDMFEGSGVTYKGIGR